MWQLMADSRQAPQTGRWPAMSYQRVSKRFEYTAAKPRTVLESLIHIVSRRGAKDTSPVWALQDVSFEVMPGESLGIIGRNGSGKSTILKLASGIIRPSSGRVTVRGRLSALLELGAGFHPDLTGQENIYLNASILGMSKEEVAACYDDIVAFSELGEFIHMPVKHYSSGMYMRLGFSVAVHVDPDILLVDEILAVGDQSFQNKCIDRIYELKRQGKTIIIVSHNLELVRSLCSHLLWIEHGHLQGNGPTGEVIAQYQQHLHRRAQDQAPQNIGGQEGIRRWGTGEIEITQVRILDETGQEQATFVTGEPLTIEMHYQAYESVREPEFGLAIFRQDGVQVNGPNNRLAGLPVDVVKGQGIIRYHIDALPLLPAAYQVSVAIHHARLRQAYDFHELAYDFRVVQSEAWDVHGLVDIPASWEWEPADAGEGLPAKLAETSE